MKLTIGICIFLLSPSVFAHHSRANFDRSTTAVLTGKITDYAWRNPHVFIEIEAEDNNGVNQTWLVEAHSVTGMRLNGWGDDSLRVGEQVTISGSPDFNSAKHFVLLDHVEKENGSKLYAFRNNNAAPARREIEASSDFSGTWTLDMRRFNARLAGGGRPTDWQYTEAGEELAGEFSLINNPELQCKEIGVPRITIYPYGINFYMSEDNLRIKKEHLNEQRVIWFDKESPELLNQAPSYVGTSYGYFKADNHLVIETNNFLATQWGSARGVNSSEEKSVLEEYVLAEDGLSIEITVTVTDPVYLSAPGVASTAYIKDENREFEETPCDPESASRHLTVNSQTGMGMGTGTPMGMAMGAN